MLSALLLHCQCALLLCCASASVGGELLISILQLSLLLQPLLRPAPDEPPVLPHQAPTTGAGTHHSAARRVSRPLLDTQYAQYEDGDVNLFPGALGHVLDQVLHPGQVQVQVPHYSTGAGGHGRYTCDPVPQGFAFYPHLDRCVGPAGYTPSHLRPPLATFH